MSEKKETVATEDGLEVEEEDLNLPIERPFDPEKLKVSTKPLVISQLVARIKHKEIELAPDFQRNMGLWSDAKQTRLIESILLKIPLPVFYVAADKNENWAVVDGLQRMSTIHHFLSDMFPLGDLEFLNQFKGKRFTELPRTMQRRIAETQLQIHIIEPGTPDEVMFNIFNRINTGGVPLNAQEVRHALHKGPVRGFLEKLAESKEFLEATDNSVNPKRMADRECVLRFIAFYEEGWENYNGNDLNYFLGGMMRKINIMTESERLEISNVFKKSMKAASGIFQDDAFRKRYKRNEGRSVVSKALFECWSAELARCDRKEIKKLLANKDKIQKAFMRLLNNDRDFEISISSSTGAPQRVKKRFSTIEELIGEYC